MAGHSCCILSRLRLSALHSALTMLGPGSCSPCSCCPRVPAYLTLTKGSPCGRGNFLPDRSSKVPGSARIGWALVMCPLLNQSLWPWGDMLIHSAEHSAGPRGVVELDGPREGGWVPKKGCSAVISRRGRGYRGKEGDLLPGDLTLQRMPHRCWSGGQAGAGGREPERIVGPQPGEVVGLLSLVLPLVEAGWEGWHSVS